MFTKHVAKLSNGIDISYADSGPVANSANYTTLIIIHGTGFDGSTFEKLHDYSSKYNFRTVVLQRPDYPGSTKYKDEELEDIKSGQKAHLDRSGLLLVSFCQHVIGKFDIPQIGEDGKSGGIAIAGWSFGAAYAMTIFADPGIIKPDVKAQLEKYVRSLVLYDPPFVCFGYEVPADAKIYDAWNQSGLTGEAQERHYTRWLSSYFDVPKDWSGDISALDHRPQTERSTIDSWTSNEQKSFFLLEPTFRGEWIMFFGPMQATLRHMAHNVLWDENTIKRILPSVSVTLLRPERSIWQCVWANWITEKRYAERKDRGEKIRPMNIISLKDGNHFIHYDYPGEFLQAIKKGIS